MLQGEGDRMRGGFNSDYSVPPKNRSWSIWAPKKGAHNQCY